MISSSTRGSACAWIAALVVSSVCLVACGPSRGASSPDGASSEADGASAQGASTSEDTSAGTTAGAGTEEKGAASDDAAIRQTIDTFLNDPANGDPGKIMQFVRDSPQVVVVYRQALLQIDDGPKDLGALMMAAFAAGNAAAQLEAGKKQDMPVQGVRAMVAVYRKVKAANASVRAAKLEDFSTRLDKGTLDAHVGELVAKAEAEEAKAKK